MLRTSIRYASTFAIGALTLSACASEPSDPVAPSRTPRLELITVTTTVAVPEDEFGVADENGNNVLCVKQTPSEQLLYKDDEGATPSQPCPPSYKAVGKGQGILVDKVWFSEDENKNGAICVKLLANGNEIVKDDNAVTPSQPCPPAFNLVGKTPGITVKIPLADVIAADDNGNFIACIKTWETTKNVMVHDDNTATPSQPCPPAFAVVSFGATESEETASTPTK
jgi:hypothetical protein